MAIEPSKCCCRRRVASCAPAWPAPTIKTSQCCMVWLQFRDTLKSGVASILGRNLDPQTVDLLVEDDLASQPRRRRPVLGAVQQVVLVPRHRRQEAGKG